MNDTTASSELVVSGSMVFGRVGHLAIEDARLQCHLCGGWFVLLGAHAWHSHGLLAKEYRRDSGCAQQLRWLASNFETEPVVKRQSSFAGTRKGKNGSGK